MPLTVPVTPDPEVQKALRAWKEAEQKQVAELLLGGGLYQRIVLTPPSPLPRSEWDDVFPERLHQACSRCTETTQTTWKRSSVSLESPQLLTYTCMACEGTRVTFMISMGVNKFVEGPTIQRPPGTIYLLQYTLEKTGQHPAWQARISNALAKALGKQGKDLFIKGASSLRAGRGIGAVAYFRRIIEDHVDQILEMVKESALTSGDADAVAELEKANKKLSATARLQIAADNTPSHLKPGGHNPLSVMYGVFSTGLHAMSDEESGKVANDLLEAITYFFESWQANKEREERYAKTITKTATNT